MKRTAIFGLTLILWILAGQNLAVDLDGDYRDSLCRFFEIDKTLLEAVEATGISEEDVAVALFIGNRTRINPVRVAGERVGGNSWKLVADSHGVAADAFFFQVVGYISSPVYNAIFEKYRSTPEDQWRDLPLSDQEIINLVNLRFLSSQHDHSVYEVMEMRDAGQSFVQIDRQVREAKQEHLAQKKKGRGAVNAGM